MRTQLKFVVLIGVALSVTPIFSSVYAQQSGSRADLFLEMQGLRSEVAELRDMVERQQYQMKKLQRSLAQQGGQGQAYSAQQAYQNNQTQTLEGYQAPPSATTDNSAPQYTQNSVDGTEPSTYSDQAAFPAGTSIGSAADAVGSAPVLPREMNPNDTYRPSTVDSGITNSADLSSAQYPGINDIPVEERVIGAAAMPTSEGSYPPVIERSIGTAGNGSNQSAQTSVLDSGFAGSDQVATTQNPIDASVASQSPSSIEDSVRFNPGFGVSNVPQAVPGQGGSGVIAIPNGTVNSATGGAVNNSLPTFDSGQAMPKVGLEQQAGVAQPQLANNQATGLSEQDYYQRGFALLKDSKHSQAVNIFKQQISNYPQGSYADDAHYWIAESMYVNRALDDSKQYFRAIIDNYSQSPRLPDAMLKTAYIEQEQGNVIEARILLQEIVQYHPRSNAAISAKNRLPELK